MAQQLLALPNSVNTLRTLPLFEGISTDILRAFLGQAHSVKFNKGQICLMQGEAATRFYIILEGWAKTIKSTPDGKELVLNLLGRGDALMETATAGSRRCPATVLAASKMKLLSVPSSVLREYLDRNHRLAANMMEAAANQTQTLISQMEQLMLRDAPQRVGWFLLRFHLLAGRKSDKITLPFDKTVIASYLGIKPETLSRTLGFFRTKGFVMHNHTVVMPDSHALCAFCTPELAQNCSRIETNECPHASFTKFSGG